MFKKLLSKVVGPVLSSLVDEAVKRELDKKTGGAASKIEDAVEGFKKRRSGQGDGRRSD